MHAGAAYGGLWIAVIGGRCVFAYGAEHWFGRAIGEFSMTHQITGADAWTAAFILMAWRWSLVRVATVTRSYRAGCPRPPGGPAAARA